MKTTINPKQCCRYTWSVFPKMSMKDVLKLNPWLFEHAYSFMAYYNDDAIIPKDVFHVEKNWLTDNFVLFSGSCNDLKDYIDKLDWEKFGTWYIYLFPSEIKANEPKFIGNDHFLENSKGEDFVDYFNTNKDWQFIHEIQPDMFITKQKNGVMIGSLNELNLWCVETEVKTKKRK